MEELSIEDRLDLKIKDLKEYLSFLINNFPDKLEDYEKDEAAKAICERYFEKIVEAMIDSGFFIVKLKKARIPLPDESVFDVLAESKIINDELAKRLNDAKSMRNFIAHQYGGIDDEKVFIAIKEELLKDTEEFIKCVESLK